MNDRAPDDHPDSIRRHLLQAGVGAAALGALPCTGILSAAAQAPFDWKRFKGEKIEVFHVKSPRGDLLTRSHKEFEELTGITVGSESAPEQQQRQKVVIEFNSGNTSFDVIEFAYAVQKRLLGKSKWLVDARPLVADKSVTEPSFAFANLSGRSNR
jgi:multiple sugar transport system substrate-binding protein